MKKNKIIVMAAALGILFSTNTATAFAQTPTLQITGQKNISFENITDEYMQKVLHDYHVAGGVVSVVKDGKVFFEKGYGYSNLSNHTPVDSITTGFQIASVSKLFTATAAMQMVEQGKLSLNKDVNEYLTAFKIKNRFSKPVTLQNLLTHTSGLDIREPLYIRTTGKALFDSLDPLENVLSKELPPVVREPGTFCQYNVYGMALAGYLVEKASGIPLDQYITENILQPLDMKNTSYGLTSSILPNMSKPYQYRNGKYLEQAYTLIGDHPSGSICTTGSDMSKFMIMHLNNGQYKGKRVLTESAAQNMHAHHFPDDSRLTGYGLGFYETIRNGYRTIEHGGSLPSFSSKMTLLPEKNIGMFIAINTDSKDSSKVCNELVDKFYQYFTDQVNHPEKNAVFDMNADKISGSYSFEGFGQTDVSKIKSVLITCKIKCDRNGNLNFTGDGLNWNFYYIGKGMFYCKDNQNYCRISESNNHIVLNVLGSDYEKISNYNESIFIAAISTLPLLLLSVLGLTVSLIQNKKKQTKFAVAHKLMMLILCILIIAYFGLNCFMALKCMEADTSIVLTVIMPMITAICYLSLALTIGSVVLVILSWIKKKHSCKSNVWYTILSLLAIINILFMNAMNGIKI
jgi:CubicO group peptidase (beta-lactamase class C family)